MTRAKGPTYQVQYRRRREGTTDFSKRLALIKSGKPRLVVRRTNKHVRIQFISFDPKGDKVLLAADDAILAKMFKWPSKRNVWTAYLLGLYAGKLAKKKGINDFILDIGMYTASKGNLVFAALKGASEAGFNVSFEADMVPSDKLNAPPEGIKDAFEQVKGKILKG